MCEVSWFSGCDLYLVLFLSVARDFFRTAFSVNVYVTVERWRRTGEVRADARPTVVRPAPAHKLSEQERQRVLDVCHEACFADLPPVQIVPRVAGEETYLTSEPSFHRILGAVQEQQNRGRAMAPQSTEPQRHVVHGPN